MSGPKHTYQRSSDGNFSILRSTGSSTHRTDAHIPEQGVQRRHTGDGHSSFRSSEVANSPNRVMIPQPGLEKSVSGGTFEAIEQAEKAQRPGYADLGMTFRSETFDKLLSDGQSQPSWLAEVDVSILLYIFTNILMQFFCYRFLNLYNLGCLYRLEFRDAHDSLSCNGVRACQLQPCAAARSFFLGPAWISTSYCPVICNYINKCPFQSPFLASSCKPLIWIQSHASKSFLFSVAEIGSFTKYDPLNLHLLETTAWFFIAGSNS